MESALVLKKRGHKPVIYEKNDHLGGTFVAASAESYKGKLRDLLSWYRREIEKNGIEVHLNTTVDDISKIEADEYIIATGSKPRYLKNVPGFEKAVEACSFLTGTPVGERVAVIGGGLTGSEIAYELALMGKKPMIVEMLDDLIKQKGVCLANSSYLREWFTYKNIPIYLNTTLKEIKDGSIVCVQDGKEFEIECDSVISSAGYIPSPLTDERKGVHLVGDALKVGNLRSVIWRAYEVAMKI